MKCDRCYGELTKDQGFLKMYFGEKNTKDQGFENPRGRENGLWVEEMGVQSDARKVGI